MEVNNVTHLLTADNRGRINTYCDTEDLSDQFFPVDWYYKWSFENNAPKITHPIRDVCPKCVKEWLESFE